ncbi:VOC family protein [Microbacterium jejuense]|uniref:VOC family protein n=1 Tax=Microbacterium jejuense TaxID=1263637 RepID=A0ABS7HT67_9MICO|nr:VOC family protein [Microbacterium jejuense]MBW9095382.1 VOC family protein [Microbacterium jejuense]
MAPAIVVATREAGRLMVTLGNITFYADDPRALAHFWSAVFGYPAAEWEEPLRQELLDAGLTPDDLDKRAVAEDPDGRGPRLYFHHAHGSKSGRNRIHLDVTVAREADDSRPFDEILDAEKDRLVGLGATVVRLVDQQWGPWGERYYQLRDPEGNEFCLQ